MYHKALSYFYKNELEKSKSLLLEIIKKEKNSNDAKILLGIIFNLTKNELKAIELFNQVLMSEINYDALINKGHSYLNISNYKRNGIPTFCRFTLQCFYLFFRI
jgi:tetratricopeptide (TPR) repeat protein